MPEFIAALSTDVYRRAILTVRTAGDPLAALPSLRAVVRAIDPAIPVFDIRTMRQVRDESIAAQRFVMALFLLFAVLALALAVVGIHGVSAQAAKARTREIGIRMALGARAADVQRLMVGRALVIVVAGLGLGTIVSLAAARLMSALLYGVQATDPVTFAAVVILLGGSSAFAAWMPARSASRSDPLRSLRSD
jgi:ABC-type antimicrobial peptide transport system permease subunit